MAEHLYESSENPDKSNRGVIVLPEIFGMNKFIKDTTDGLAQELSVKAFALDHFFAVTGKSQVYEYDNHEAPFAMMQQLTGEKFMELFKASIDEISTDHPDIKSFIVVGFCFGGRLAFLAGTDKRVGRIASFYGAGSVQPGFYQDKSAIEALSDARTGDNDLRILGLFGESDPSIPAETRQLTETALKTAKIDYQAKVYDTGHAFMNFERANLYSKAASEQAWVDLIQFLIN